MKLDEAIEILDERVDDPEIASEITKLLGLFRIKAKGQKKGRAEYLLGWEDAERALNDIAAKEYKGVKKFR
jgi:hypothetical protein